MNYFMIDNFVFGGAERQASYLINNNIGFDKIILIEDERKYELNTKKPIITLNPRILKIFQRPLGDSKSRKKLEKVFTSSDTVLSFLERSNIMNIKTSLKTKHKAIISVRNYLSKRYSNLKYFYRMTQIKKYYPLAELIITNSQESKNDLVNYFGVPKEKIKVIYNLIDLDAVEILKEQEIEKEYKNLFNKPVILNIGSLTPQKSQNQLIEVFKLVKEHYPEYKLVVIGTGKLKRKLLKTIKKLSLENEVYLLGNVKNPFKYLNRSEIFILNSDFEGFPNVLLEALAVGIPVISKNCLSGPSEMLEIFDYNNRNILLTKYGYLFPKNYNRKLKNYEDEKVHLFKCISSLIEMKKKDEENFKRIKLQCRRRAQDFSLKKIIEQWSKLIN